MNPVCPILVGCLFFSLFVLQDGIRVSDVIMAEDLHLCWS